MPSTKVDVLIVGAGPAGLTCAYSLSQAGCHVRVVDKKTVRLQKGQGDVLQARGMEIIDSLGLSSQILKDSQRCIHTATYASSPTSNGELTLISRNSVISGLESTMPFMAMYAQSSVEGIIREALASGKKHIPSATFVPQPQPLGPSHKVEIEQGVFPTEMKVADSLEQEYPVTVRLARPDGQTEIVQTKYLLGCDGAHSWTRTQLGIEMVGETSDQVWGVIDGYVETDFPDLRALTIFDNNGRHAVLIPRENDMVRFTVQLNDSDVCVDPTTGRVDRTKIGAEKILVKEVLKPYHVEFKKGVDWSGVYVIGQRLASRYQDQSGRVFILGDACHTHSPHAGQGMNAAISDAHNLSWKLVHVLKGWATPDLLQTYESERRDFAVQLIDLHARIAEFMSGKVKGTSSDLMMKSLKFVAGVATHYPASTIVDPSNQLLASGIVIGERFPHQVILRTADFRPYSTLNLLKSDNVYKIIILTGDFSNTVQHQKLEKLGESLNQWLLRRPRMFQTYTLMPTKKENATYTDVPKSLCPYWDTVFLDDTAYAEKDGGGRAYQSFGVGPEGCLVLVRPDGHVAALAPLEEVQALQALSSIKVPLPN